MDEEQQKNNPFAERICFYSSDFPGLQTGGKEQFSAWVSPRPYCSQESPRSAHLLTCVKERNGPFWKLSELSENLAH